MNNEPAVTNHKKKVLEGVWNFSGIPSATHSSGICLYALYVNLFGNIVLYLNSKVPI
jgi:hypothetical protein